MDTLAGKPLALVYNFAGHPYCGVPGGGVSADFPGFASRVIEEAWPGAVALFVQGAAGDITPVRYKDFDAPPPTEQLGTRLGLSALQAAQDDFHQRPGRRSRPPRNRRASPTHRYGRTNPGAAGRTGEDPRGLHRRGLRRRTERASP